MHMVCDKQTANLYVASWQSPHSGPCSGPFVNENCKKVVTNISGSNTHDNHEVQLLIKS